MSDQELLAETNRLLKQFFEWNQEQKGEAERMVQKFEAERNKLEQERQLLPGAGERKGIEVEGVDLNDENFEAKFNEIREKSKRHIEEAKERELRYREELMVELHTQTELLRQIKERLGRG